MENVPDANFVFGEDRRVQRNLVPIRKCIPAFNAECRSLSIAIEMLDIAFNGNIEAIRQTHFTLQGPVIIRRTIMHIIEFINDTAINFTGWKDIGIR